MVALTEELILKKTGAESLSTVKNLNLWGSDLTDVSILERLSNVEVLSLSVNKISSLQDFRCCPQLSELYLRKNEIADIREVLYLQGLKNLSILWLCDNPCVGSSAAEYRQKVIALLPRITKLDNVDVTEDERSAAERSQSQVRPNPSAAPASPSAAIATSTPSKSPAPTRPAPATSNQDKRSNTMVAITALLNDLSADELASVRSAALKLMQAKGRPAV